MEQSIEHTEQWERPHWNREKTQALQTNEKQKNLAAQPNGRVNTHAPKKCHDCSTRRHTGPGTIRLRNASERKWLQVVGIQERQMGNCQCACRADSPEEGEDHTRCGGLEANLKPCCSAGRNECRYWQADVDVCDDCGQQNERREGGKLVEEASMRNNNPSQHREEAEHSPQHATNRAIHQYSSNAQQAKQPKRP